MRQLKIAVVSVIIFAGCISAFASMGYQSIASIQATGKIRGTVRFIDSNGLAISNALVTLNGEGLTYKVSTDSNGTYEIEAPPGIYHLRFDSAGFCPSRRAAFQLRASTVV